MQKQQIKTCYDAHLNTEYIISIMRSACDYEIKKPKYNRDWIYSAFMTGLMATYYTTKDKKYLEYALNWAEKGKWKLLTNRKRHADDHCAGQTYLELYLIKKDNQMMAHTKAHFDWLIAHPKPGRIDWWWEDALFMAPPVIARLGRITDEKKYYDYLNAMFWDCVENLVDVETGLLFRDNRYKRTSRDVEKRGKFWSRGNGWVVAGIVRTLDFLPESNEKFSDYVALLDTMANAVAKYQCEDGLWRMGLTDIHTFPQPETSGTGFFCYAMAKGVNNGWLDRRFIPVVQKAWQGLTNCVEPNGRIGWVQPVGHAPYEISSSDYVEYGAGAFLLAGSEVVKMVAKNPDAVGSKSITSDRESERLTC